MTGRMVSEFKHGPGHPGNSPGQFLFLGGMSLSFGRKAPITCTSHATSSFAPKVTVQMRKMNANVSYRSWKLEVVWI